MSRRQGGDRTEEPSRASAGNIVSGLRESFLFQVAAEVLRGFRRNHLDARSAQLAYYSLLGIAPLLILLIAAFARLPVQGSLDRLLSPEGGALPPEALDVLVDQIHDIEAHSTPRLALIGLLTLAYAGVRCYPPQHSAVFCASSRHLKSTAARPGVCG